LPNSTVLPKDAAKMVQEPGTRSDKTTFWLEDWSMPKMHSVMVTTNPAVVANNTHFLLLISTSSEKPHPWRYV
jgi:hypothetical protein